ncbi:Detected protein of unknown function [Hibiscus syriacus]|uniref:ZCF37 n=1 Tax=Hibiscus syriacus TaxID=106335 RepID=A0A6A3AIQ6_HIBSY|nr:uncharacterized protein LOC120128691 [Hibiscus syriacus]KAE8702692.1 Detected protein of unknown function [Hibiscus syriacus]
MFYSFVCGSFHHQEGDDESWIRPVSTPKRSRRKRDNENPYSTRGLDQFYALLAELEEKRQRIYSQMGNRGVVRFVYKNSNYCVPLVVKPKDKKEEKIKPATISDHQPRRDKLQTTSESDRKIKKEKSISWNDALQNLRRPSHYIPAVIILILVSLVCFGRSVAILCTCIGWYTVSATSEEGSNLRTSMKKKNYVGKLSENKAVTGKLSSPKSKKFGATREKFPQSI